LLMQIFQRHEVEMKTLAGNLTAKACALSGKSWEVGALLKKARLPRLAKALVRASHA